MQILWSHAALVPPKLEVIRTRIMLLPPKTANEIAWIDVDPTGYTASSASLWSLSFISPTESKRTHESKRSKILLHFSLRPLSTYGPSIDINEQAIDNELKAQLGRSRQKRA